MGIIITSATQVGIVLAASIAILKYRLYDIDILINRTLVYGALTALIVGLYVLTVGVLGAAFQAQGNLGISLVATGMVAVVFQPLRSRLQHSVNRLMYGERDEPYLVLSRLGHRLEATFAPGELGLIPAMRETAASHNMAGRLRIEVEGPDAMPLLPAAVEVVAYRIAQEALHNVATHSSADSCVVRFTLKDALELEVLDNGVGLPEKVRAGVGLISMNERASELGGSFAIEPATGGGTRVRARLPLLGLEI